MTISNCCSAPFINGFKEDGEMCSACKEHCGEEELNRSTFANTAEVTGTLTLESLAKAYEALKSVQTPIVRSVAAESHTVKRLLKILKLETVAPSSLPLSMLFGMEIVTDNSLSEGIVEMRGVKGEVVGLLSLN